MRHIISVLLENEPGALSRVSGLFSARGYNIESLTVAPTHDSTLSRMTIVTNGDERRIDQIEKHLNKLVDVAALQDVTVDRHLEREVILVKVSVAESEKTDFERAIGVFNANLIDITGNCFVVELNGSSEKNDELLKALNRYSIIEVARSGVTALALNERTLAI